MREWQNQSHVRWYCRYHIIIVPQYRQKAIFGTLRKDIGKILRALCEQMGIELVEGHAMPDHVHLCLRIPPKYSVANAVGRLKGKAAIRMHREYLGRTRNFTGLHFWARGYCVSIVGFEGPSSGNTSAIKRSKRNAPSNGRWGISHHGGKVSTLMGRVQVGPQPPTGASCNSALGEGLL